MSNIKLDNLNYYCLAEILKQIKNNCDVENKGSKNIIKYADLISFALTCKKFYNILREWDYDLFDKLDINYNYFNPSRFLFVHLDELYKKVQTSTQREKDVFWNLYMNSVKSNAHIADIIMNYDGQVYNKDHQEIMDMFMNAIKNNSQIETLDIKMDGFFLDRLPQLQDLKRLTVNAKINASDLVECCKSNPKLKRLEILNNQIYGRLTDIVPYCEKLKELTFKIKPDFSDTEYKQFGKLPNLEILNIVGVHEGGSLSSLTTSLTSNEMSRLKRLTIDSVPIESSDIFKLCAMPSLRQLKCRIINMNNFHLIIKQSYGKSKEMTLNFEQAADATNIAPLANLSRLEHLQILGQHRAGTLRVFLKGIPKSLNLRVLMCKEYTDDVTVTKFNNDEIMEVFKIKSLQTLNCGFSDTQPMAFPNQLPAQIQRITIRSHKSGFVQNLFKAFSQQSSPELKQLSIDGSLMSLEDVIEISKIKSLLTLRCGFSHLNDMLLLVQLSELQSLTISSNHLLYDFSLEALRYFEAANRTVSICSLENCLSIDKTVGLLTISMTPDINVEDLEPLASLPNLHSLVINKSKSTKSLTTLFRAFANSTNRVLQELYIHDMKPYPNQLATHPDREELTQQDLDKLKFVSLTEFAQAESLHISGRHKLRAAKDLKGLLNVKQYSSLGEINYKVKNNGAENLRTQITCEETVEISKISNLKRLECDFSDVKCVEMLAKMPNLEELTLTRCPEGSLRQLLLELATIEHCNLKSLNLMGTTLVYEQKTQNSMEMFEYSFADGQLKDSSNPCDSLATLIQTLTSTELQNLHRLAVRNQTISYENMLIISQMKNLRSFYCNAKDKECFKLVVQLPELTELTLILNECEGIEIEGIEILAQLPNLTRLELALPRSVSLTQLFKHLSLRESPVLETLIIVGKDIEESEMQVLGQLKSLKELLCGFAVEEFHNCLSHLTNLVHLYITNEFQFYNISQTLTNILQNCHKLTEISFNTSRNFISFGGLEESSRNFKTSKYPQVQETVKVQLSKFYNPKPKKIFINDKSFFIQCTFQDESDS